MTRKLKLAFVSVVLAASTSCSFWWDNKVWSCQELQNGVWQCDSADV